MSAVRGAENRFGDVPARAAILGLLGWLLFFVFSGYNCERCGTVPRKEFPKEVRGEMLAGTFALLGFAALAFVGLINLLTTLR